MCMGRSSLHDNVNDKYTNLRDVVSFIGVGGEIGLEGLLVFLGKMCHQLRELFCL